MRRVLALLLIAAALVLALRTDPGGRAPRSAPVTGAPEDRGVASAAGAPLSESLVAAPLLPAEALELEEVVDDSGDVLPPLEPEPAVVGKSWSFEPKRNFPEWDLGFAGGALPDGLRVYLNLMAGVPRPPAGRYVFTLEARKGELRRERTYSLTVVEEPLRLVRVDFDDVVRDRRVGEGDSLLFRFDGAVNVVDPVAPEWRLADGSRPFGVGSCLRRVSDDTLDLILGRGASFGFAGGTLIVVVGGPSVQDWLGAALPVQQARIRDEPRPFVYAYVGEPLLPVPLSSVDPPEAILRVTGLPEGLRCEDGFVVGIPLRATQPSRDFPVFTVEDREGRRQKVRYDVFEPEPLDPEMRILSVEPPEPRVGDVVRVRYAGPDADVVVEASGIPRGWWKPSDEAAWLPASDGEELFFLDHAFEGIPEIRLRLIRHRGRSEAVPVRLRREAVAPERTPRVTSVERVTTAEGPFLVLRGFWLAGPAGREDGVRVVLDGVEVEPFRVSRRFGAVRLPPQRAEGPLPRASVELR